MSAREQLEALAAAARDWTPGSGSDLDVALEQMRRSVDLERARRAAVLILFGTLDDRPAEFSGSAAPADLDVLLIERAATLNSHPGQVAFPGGGVDPDDDGPAGAALREAEEETGLDPAGVRVLGLLPEMGLPVSNFLVTPVLAWWEKPTPVDVVDYAESAQVFRVPVADLLDPANRRTAVVRRGRMVHRTPAFTVNGVLVWGFTGMILDALLERLGWTLPWDRALEIEPPL